jgi:toxin FitB
MSFLLDTSVVSEWTKPYPDPGVIEWLEAVDEDRVFLSVVTLVELRYGLERLAAGKKRKRLEEWFEHELPLRFEERVLNIDAEVANMCGKLVAHRETEGRPIEAMDALLAATAEVHRLTVVTRNDADFHGTVRCLNPWS